MRHVDVLTTKYFVRLLIELKVSRQALESLYSSLRPFSFDALADGFGSSLFPAVSFRKP